MAYLTIFSETGTPHSGCLLEYSDDFEWLSFMPPAKSPWDVFPGGNFGYIDTTDREKAISAYIRFRLAEDALVRGRNNTVADYYSASYGLFICDCVSFSRDLSKACGLRTPFAAYDPDSLVNTLAEMNRSKATHINYKPYPWNVHRQKKDLKDKR